jgi:hypothetical protein
MRLDPATLAHRADSELLREFQGLSIDGADSGAVTLRFATVSGQYHAIPEAELPHYLKECEALLNTKHGDVYRQSQLTPSRRALVWSEFTALNQAKHKLHKLAGELEYEQLAGSETAALLNHLTAMPRTEAAKLERIFRSWKVTPRPD